MSFEKCKISPGHVHQIQIKIYLIDLYLYTYITLFQSTSEFKEKPAIEENAFEALERDFQEVCISMKRLECVRKLVKHNNRGS